MTDATRDAAPDPPPPAGPHAPDRDVANVANDRDQRAHARDVAAAKRDAEAAVRGGLEDEHVVSEREVAARAAARTDRESPLLDRLASAETASLRRERATLPSGAASSRFRYARRTRSAGYGFMLPPGLFHPSQPSTFDIAGCRATYPPVRA